MTIGMKKIILLAISAIVAANINAHEKQECEGKQLSKEQRVEMQIRHLTDELMLSDKQAANFAVTFREYSQELDKLFEKGCPRGKACKADEVAEKDDAALDKRAKERFEGHKKLADLQAKFYDKFRKDLSARQTAKVMHLDEPFGAKGCCGKCDKQGHKGHHGQHALPGKEKKD